MVFKQYIRHYIIYFIVMALGSRILLLVGELLNTYHSQNLQLCLALLFILSWLMTTILIVCIHRFSNNNYDQIFKMILGCVFLFHITQQLTFMDPPINHEPSINLETVFFIDVLTQVVYLALGSRLSALRPSFYLPAIGVIVLLFFYHWRALGQPTHEILLEDHFYPDFYFQIFLCLAAGLIYHATSRVDDKKSLLLMSVIIVGVLINEILLICNHSQLSWMTLIIESLRLFFPLMLSFIAGWIQQHKIKTG